MSGFNAFTLLKPYEAKEMILTAVVQAWLSGFANNKADTETWAKHVSS